MGKINKIISEIQNFFSKKRLSSVMETFTNLLDDLPVDSRMLGALKRDNCKMTNLQVFQRLVLLPFFGVLGFSDYAESVLNRIFGGKKDILYSFMSCGGVDWRSVIYRINGFLTVRKEQGLTSRQRNDRYSRKREEGCPASVRMGEYLRSKGEVLVEMVKMAIKARIPFDYLLVDSCAR